ncbi:MAG: hypothetical protein C4576_19800 [Desulfobacteraceae bacterium]|nr:MAG: hypothetical protein C4576_19800 [Desulfobacteraceae bacterium]
MDPLPKITRIGNGRNSLRVHKPDLEAWLGKPVQHDQQFLTLDAVAKIVGLSKKTLHNRLSAARKGNPRS